MGDHLADKEWISGFAGHKPAPHSKTRLRMQPCYEGEHELPEPRWPKVYSSLVVGYGGRPGFYPKPWSTHPAETSTYRRTSSVPCSSLAGHPALTTAKDDFRRSLHGMAGYAGHKPAAWRVDKALR
eukprot:CAMPEP_0170621080 /NCGR_PEP_ID=MMETSP0224-20130122/28411_1 /TAXON_ID=285029 /ORGANISM="Togula jolla, Strain CCCM 725" /LENGTH=125 /DNA_ID=CAMNT_0010947317 /DNA_START=82 /DNA_END=462 /DNA_ORIENTATION=+